MKYIDQDVCKDLVDGTIREDLEELETKFSQAVQNDSESYDGSTSNVQ